MPGVHMLPPEKHIRSTVLWYCGTVIHSIETETDRSNTSKLPKTDRCGN